MPEKLNEELLQEVKGITDTLRKKADELGVSSGEVKQYMEKADSKLKEFDEKNDKLTTDLQTAQDEVKTLKEAHADLEAKLVILTSDKTQKKIDGKAATRFMGAMLSKQFPQYVEENEAEATAILTGMKGMPLRAVEGDGAEMSNLLQRKAATDLIRSDIGELGGYLCPPEYANSILHTQIEYAPVRQYAQIRTTTSKQFIQPVRVGIPTATRPGEAQTGGSSVSKYAMKDFSPKRMTNTIAITRDELLFNAYNVTNDMITDNAMAFGVKEGQEFFNGDGVKGGKGWSVDSDVPEVSSGTASTIDFDDIIGMTAKLKAGYDPMFMFNRGTLGHLRLLKDENGRYLWNGPFGSADAGSPATINGIRYSSAFIEFDDYDTDGGYPILLADMKRFYMVADRQDITVIRDDVSQKNEGIVEFTFAKYTYGQVLMPEAGIRLVVTAA